MPETTLESRVEQLEARVVDLEEALERFIRLATGDLRQLRGKLRDMQEQLAADSERLRAHARERDEREEMREYHRRAEEDRKAMNRKWCDLAIKMGTVVEDVFAPSMPELATEYFGCTLVEDFSARRARTMPEWPYLRREFDIILVCPDQVILVEERSPFREKEARRFKEFVDSREFFEYFPEYSSRRLVPVFAALDLTPAQVDLLSRLGLHAMSAGDELPDILNPELERA